MQNTAVIGDIVNSRAGGKEVYEVMKRGLDTLSDIPAVAALAPTVGDEIQGVFASLGDAFAATHRLRLQMLIHGYDIRFGIGYGDVVQLDPDNEIESGSAWWTAREAIDAVASLAKNPGWSGVRTGLRHPTDLQAYAHLIDTRLSSFSATVNQTLVELLAGTSNTEAASKLGITASANTQRVAQHHLHPLREAMYGLWRS